MPAAATWLDAWSDVLRLCDLSGIDSIRAFDDRFSMYQSLFNWSQDLEDALGNAGREDPEFLRARIAICEQALSRFPDEDELMVGNRRRALAESYFELGETSKAEALFEQWLEADPRWGWGWIGWADLHFFADGLPRRTTASGAGACSRTRSQLAILPSAVRALRAIWGLAAQPRTSPRTGPASRCEDRSIAYATFVRMLRRRDLAGRGLRDQSGVPAGVRQFPPARGSCAGIGS